MLPAAANLQKTIYTQENQDDFYVVGGSTNVDAYDGLLEFKKENNINFSLATEKELGFRFLTNFYHNFIFIGKNNIIIGTLEDDADVEEMDLMFKRTMASFYDLHIKKEKDIVLLTGQTTELELKDYFHALDFSKFEFIIRNSSNNSIVSPMIFGSKLILNKTSVKGFSNISVLAKVPGKEVFVQTVFQVINPSELYEDFEIEKLEDSKIPWVNTGVSEWFVTSDNSFFNSKSIRSGRIPPNQTSGIALQLDLASPGTLIFAYKTSTRPYYDRLHFTLDGLDISDSESPNFWSGVNDWRIMSFSIRAGLRNFSWEYIKGPYEPYNDDIVWLDMIVIPDKFNKNTSDVNSGSKVTLSSFPNPFNPVTEISFEMLTNEKAELMVFDIKGRLVAELFNGELTKGAHSFSFDGSGLSSGLYFSVLKYGDKILTNKLILSK